LNNLKPASVKVSTTTGQGADGEGIKQVKVENTSGNLAFFLRLRLNQGKGAEEVLPIFWEDNYFSLMPGETREITTSYKQADLNGAEPVVDVEGWNVERTSE